MAITAIPIQPVQDVSGNQWRAFRIIEENAQTFKAGTVVAVAGADGGIIAWGGATVSGAVGSPVGISYEAASNLATTGKGAPLPNQPVVGIGAAVGTFGSVPNEPSAVNIAHGAPFNDGRVGLFSASPDTYYSAVLGNAGNPATPTNALLSTNPLAGLTLDTGANFWYVDLSKTNLVQIIGLDPRDTPAAGSRVIFRFIQTAVQQLG
jgi:hypothetical protein